MEEFNRILISRVRLPAFERGIKAFIEKENLLPFEEAKLYGHNAVHALVGYLARHKGCAFLCEVAQDAWLVRLAREAFLEESGPALIARHRGVDPLFTPEGYRAYAEDLLVRMVNPYLALTARNASCGIRPASWRGRTGWWERCAWRWMPASFPAALPLAPRRLWRPWLRPQARPGSWRRFGQCLTSRRGEKPAWSNSSKRRKGG